MMPNGVPVAVWWPLGVGLLGYVSLIFMAWHDAPPDPQDGAGGVARWLAGVTLVIGIAVAVLVLSGLWLTGTAVLEFAAGG